MLEGILLVDKPEGWTSFDVVNYVRRIVADIEDKKPKHVKVGHSGTLDPFATGLLILLIGKTYTKRASEFSKLDKTYELTMRLGNISTTGDPEGTIEHLSANIPPKTAILSTIDGFIGEQMQVPPAYSAIKVNGQRAYKLARAGKAVELEPRKVVIKQLELLKYKYPDIHLRARVSSGTFIRSLAQDIGAVLTTGAYTIALKRTRINNLDISESISPKLLTKENIEQFIEK